MPLSQLSRADVLAAVAEFDRLGRDAFLAAAGFGRARNYFLIVDGRRYDSKAIAGYAHGLGPGVPLGPEDFSGGDRTVAKALRELGFEVRYLRNPDWRRDEIVLAVDLVWQNGWKQMEDTDGRVVALSELLQSPLFHPLEGRMDTFRNSNGVARKTADIATSHPAAAGKRTNGNRLDREVLLEFLDRPEEMHAEAEAIREAVGELDPDALPRIADPDLGGVSADEGDILVRRHLRRERDPKLKAAKLAEVRGAGGSIACEACGFDFGRVYGPHGDGYIECHHRTPLSVSGPTRTRPSDLALVCSNCHRMIHRRPRDWLTVEELAALVRART